MYLIIYTPVLKALITFSQTSRLCGFSTEPFSVKTKIPKPLFGFGISFFLFASGFDV